MNVNDVLCLGARPLFFLDYIACGRLRPKVLVDVVKGITAGCLEAGCALIGGETAEMPGMYRQDEYDLAGFAVGIIDKDKIIDGSKIRAGDVIVGIESNGLHSNGFSLVRKVFLKREIKALGSELLRPTRIYTRAVLALIEKFNIKGIAHITGGAFYEKATKVLPPGLCLYIKKESWPVPYIFKLIQKKAHLDGRDMYRTFNMGIGLILVVSKSLTYKVHKQLLRYNLKSWVIGEVIKGKGAVIR
jgi:phosphoribosylformylglycinamidine cyclo-ligase